MTTWDEMDKAFVFANVAASAMGDIFKKMEKVFEIALKSEMTMWLRVVQMAMDKMDMVVDVALTLHVKQRQYIKYIMQPILFLFEHLGNIKVHAHTITVNIHRIGHCSRCTTDTTTD